jgi:hypothetical protein
MLTFIRVLRLCMYKSCKYLFLKLDWHCERHTIVHFVHCCSVVRKEIDAVLSDYIVTSDCVIFKYVCTELRVYWANYYIQYIQFRIKKIISNWTENYFQACSKWSKACKYSNSKCPSNNEFSNLNCSLWNFHNFAHPLPVYSWSLQD